MQRSIDVAVQRALAKIEGPTFFGGCSEMCCDSEWPVSKMPAEAFDNKLMVGDFAVITKHKPNGCESAMMEAMTDSDTYTIEFNQGVQLAPQQKALVDGETFPLGSTVGHRWTACSCRAGFDVNGKL